MNYTETNDEAHKYNEDIPHCYNSYNSEMSKGAMFNIETPNIQMICSFIKTTSKKL